MRRILSAFVRRACTRRKQPALLRAAQTPVGEWRGFTIVEMIVAAILMSVAMMAALPLLGLAAVQSQYAEQYQIAQLEVANVMEQIAVNPPGELKERDDASALPISGTARELLPEARLQVRAVDLPGPPAALHVTVELTWKDRAGTMVSPVRLVQWFYPASAAPRTTSNERNR